MVGAVLADAAEAEDGHEAAREGARRGFVAAAMVAIVCSSWGPARGRACVLRSRSEPFGLACRDVPLSLTLTHGVFGWEML